MTSVAPEKKRRPTVTVSVPTDAPDCPFKDEGLKNRRNNVNYCLADCFGLIEDAAYEDNCRFHRDTWRAADQPCPTDFLPNKLSTKKVFCNFDPVSLESAKFGRIKSNASQWIVNSNFCTHILLYPLLKYDEDKKIIVFMDDYYKTMAGHIKTFQSAQLKVLLTIGNWWDRPQHMPQTISPKLFSSIAKNDDQRNSFVTDVVNVVKKYSLDGINVRWIFPGSPFGATDGTSADKINYVTLLNNFTSLLKPEGLLLTTECSAIIDPVIKKGLDITKVSEAVDYLLVYATDYGRPGYAFTSLTTPIKEVRQSLEFYKNQINNDNQIILSIKSDIDMQELKIFNKLAKPGSVIILEKREQIPWYKFLTRALVTERDNWEITKSNVEGQSFACNGLKWAAFDDINSIQQRVDIVRSLGLGGVHVISAFNDDISDDIGCGAAPILRTINEILRGFNGCVLPACPLKLL